MGVRAGARANAILLVDMNSETASKKTRAPTSGRERGGNRHVQLSQVRVLRLWDVQIVDGVNSDDDGEPIREEEQRKEGE